MKEEILKSINRMENKKMLMVNIKKKTKKEIKMKNPIHSLDEVIPERNFKRVLIESF